MQGIDPYRPYDVLDALLPHVLEGIREAVADMVANRARNANLAGLRQRFQSSRDIDAVAVNITPVPDDVAEVDPHTELDAPRLGDVSVSLGHRLLHLDRAAHRIDDAGELDQEPVAGGFDDAASVLLDLRIAQLAADRLHFSKRALLVVTHQPRISRHIGGEDSGEAAGRGHGWGRPPWVEEST